MIERLLEAAIRTWGAAASILGIVLSFLGFFIAPAASSLPTRWVLVSWSAAFVLLIIALRALHDSVVYQRRSPKACKLSPPPGNLPGASAVLLVEESPFFAVDGMVSVYYLEDGLERMIAVGIVTNVQNDRRVQIGLQASPGDPILERLLTNNGQDELARIIVKPSVPSAFLVRS